MPIKEFARRHNIPENIVILVLEKFGVKVDEDTLVKEEALLEVLKPILEEFKRQNPIVGKWDPTDICK